MSRPIGRTIVTYGLAAIGGLIGAILLWLSTGFVADFLLGLSGMSPREGRRAMVAFFAIGHLVGCWASASGSGWCCINAAPTAASFAGAVLQP